MTRCRLISGSPKNPVTEGTTACPSARRGRIGGCDVPRIRLHDLRHTFATLALEAGIAPKVVSEILGHSSIAITLDTYSHVVPEMQQEATSKVAGLVSGTT
jgi:integrase